MSKGNTDAAAGGGALYGLGIFPLGRQHCGNELEIPFLPS
jgi:hypothetical protein